MLENITPIILTYNEADNIERTLNALTWAKEVVVIDSYSDDATLSLCRNFDNVRLVQREFDGASQQCNFALEQNIQTEWVLSLDADYVLSSPLIKEMTRLEPQDHVSGFKISFDYLINGNKLKGSLYPPRLSLYRLNRAHYIQDGHTQRVIVKGEILKLYAKIKHDDRKPYSRWRTSQRRYALMEANKIRTLKWQSMTWPDRVRYVGLGPLTVIPFTLLGKGLIFNGWPGLVYTGQRCIAETYLLFARFGLIKN